MKLAALALLLTASVAFAADEDPIDNPRLPRLWKVVERKKASAEQVAALSKRLELPLDSIENAVVDAGGVGVKVNVAKCADEAQAETLRKRFATIHGGDDVYAVRRGCEVAEIVCVNRAVARKARHVLGWDTTAQWVGPAHYRTTMQIAPLVRCDGMRWNKLFNLLSKSADPKFGAAIEEEAKAFEFADRLAGRDEPPTPAAERVHGVPRIQREVLTSVPVFGTSWTSLDTSKWTAPTEWWPTYAPEVRAAANEALGADPPKSAQERAERILAWVHAHIRYGGDAVGSRYGTTAVLTQGFGRCWDQSDVFVALCRAAGVPARQVGGWLKGGEGHVWAEVVVGQDRGKSVTLPVDPGTTWLGVSEDYVGLWSSDDGSTPFVYWGAPKIDVLPGGK